jgi:hypothetical protein
MLLVLLPPLLQHNLALLLLLQCHLVQPHLQQAQRQHLHCLLSQQLLHPEVL